MRATTAAPAAALFATVLLLSACSGGSKPTDKIKTGDAGKSPSHAATSAPSGAASRPVDLPAGLTVSFTPETTGDAKKDAVLNTDAQFLRAAHVAFTDWNTEKAPFRDYSTGAASQWVVGNVGVYRTAHGGSVPTGTVRFTGRRVHFAPDGSAAVAECQLGRDFFDKNKKTGEVYRTAPSDADYQYYVIHYLKGPDGRWMADKVTGRDKAVDECAQ